MSKTFCLFLQWTMKELNWIGSLLNKAWLWKYLYALSRNLHLNLSECERFNNYYYKTGKQFGMTCSLWKMMFTTWCRKILLLITYRENSAISSWILLIINISLTKHLYSTVIYHAWISTKLRREIKRSNTALTYLVYGYRNHGLRDRIMGGSDYKTDVREDQDGVRIFTVWDHL